LTGQGLGQADALAAGLTDVGVVQETVAGRCGSFGVSDVRAAQTTCRCVADVVHTGDASELVSSSDRTVRNPAEVVGCVAVEFVHEFAVHCPGRIEGVSSLAEFALKLGDSLSQCVVVGFELGGAPVARR